MSTSTETRRDLPTLAIKDTPLRWTRVETGYDGGTGWLHSGITALPDGSLLIAHPEGRNLVRIDTDGTSVRIPTELTEMHCITVASGTNGRPVVWVADNGFRYIHDSPRYGENHLRGRLVALDLDGAIVQELEEPTEFGAWKPTSVMPTNPNDPASDIWVADGYGQMLIHRFAADGTLLSTLDGTKSGKAFNCPHGILLREVNGEQLLYVADRRNTRICVFDLNGNFVRTLAENIVNSPSSMVDHNGYLVVTELFGALAVFDGDDYIGHIGSSGRDHTADQWPNVVNTEGQTVAPELVDGKFNSPHGITSRDGSLYLTEWVIGGRVVRLDFLT